MILSEQLADNRHIKAAEVKYPDFTVHIDYIVNNLLRLLLAYGKLKFGGIELFYQLDKAFYRKGVMLC